MAQPGHLVENSGQGRATRRRGPRSNPPRRPLLTKTLLIHALTAGGTAGGPRLVAYDKARGAELASLDLPSGALGAPMTYLIDGRQQIALTVGGEVPGLVVFGLPE